MQSDDWKLLILLGMMAMSLRLIGLYGGKYVSGNAVAQAMLQALPGSLLVALVVPDLISRGIAGWLAMAATLALMKLTRNTVASMVGGIAVTAICRLAGLPG